MKIAIIIRKLNVRGGVQRHVLSLAHEYKKLGHRVKLYTFIADPEEAYAELMAGLDITSLNFLPQPSRMKFLGHFNYFIGLWREARAAKRLAYLIDRDVDILNPHDHVCYKAAYFFKKLIGPVPSVWMIHDLPTKTFSLLRARELNPNLRTPLIKRFFYWLIDKYEILKYIKKQDQIAVLDKRDQEWVRDYFDKQAFLVRNGIEIARFPYRAREPISPRGCRLLMNGIFLSHRRFEDGLEAARILKDKGYDIEVTIVGDQSGDRGYYDKIKSLVIQLNLTAQVKFPGRLSEQELLASYHHHDIFLFPNHLQSWGLTVFEAMATGLPVIVSKSAGASEVLTHRENALIALPKSPATIAQGVEELIGSRSLYSHLSRNGRKFVEANISWGRLAGEMEKIFKVV